MLKKILSHPLTRHQDIDAPETTELRKRIIQEKPFLKQIYLEWYRRLAAALPESIEAPVLELGAGGGFMKEHIPALIASDVLHIPSIDVVLDGRALPVPADSLRGIVMTNVFHHLPDPGSFLRETERCLKPGGVLAMIEPWVTPWSEWVYRRLHHEPFEPDAPQWEFPQSGPLSGANNALAWIVFERDRERFEREFPFLQIQKIHAFMPFRYLLSGGVSLRSLAPGWMFNFWRALETGLPAWQARSAMFVYIVVQRRTQGVVVVPRPISAGLTGRDNP